MSLCLELVKEVNSITDLLIKLGKVIEVALDLFDGKVDKHSCDLGSSPFSNELLNIFVDELSNNSLVVGVLRNDGWEITDSLLVVSVDDGVNIGKRCLRTA